MTVTYRDNSALCSLHCKTLFFVLCSLLFVFFLSSLTKVCSLYLSYYNTATGSTMSSAILDIMDPPTLSIAIFHQSENKRNEDTGRESESLQVKQAQREWE